MEYPEFFNGIEKIVLKDDLSDFLGVFKEGILEFSYLDIVKSAGHSCPTIAGAYLMTLKGLKALYGGELPLRGGIEVSFKESEGTEVTGVIANAIENITGATRVRGFKGIGGKFVRHSLMFFDAPVESSVRFTRIDSGKQVDVFYNPGKVPGDPGIMELMPSVLQGKASTEEKKLFGTLWQQRVKNIFSDSESVISVSEVMS